MPLTDTAIRNAKPGAKPVKLFDERGLFLIVTPSGGKWWRFRYKFDGKEKLLSLGVYPDVPLASRVIKDEETGKTRKIKGARELRDEARELLAQGIDPGENRKAQKATKQNRAASSFEVVAREWYSKYASSWSEAHGERIIRRFERDVFPWIGGRPIADIAPSELLSVVRRVESRGALETAHRALANCGQVFRYAVATGRAERDPSGDLRGALPPVKGEHFAAVTEPKQVGQLLRTLDGYEGTFVVACALRLAPLVFVRPGELRKAEWKDINLDAGEWRYTVTKTGTPHIVPLSTQAVSILRELHALTGTGRFVFPGARSTIRPMSDNAILAALRRMGIPKDEMSGHGFRAMARTILDEVLGVRPDLIEHQLAHAVRDPNGRAYNRTAHLPERRKMMQQWADYLDKLKAGAEVIGLKGNVAYL
ncbi:integrase [Nitrosospira multiformis]|uniref:Integrase n=1 Tax=Nitrosospira multiformis TaxID=1231 RepID=A0A2T5I7L6_9PROT|nr:integrase arm-type DNA-binding domain-containing protein [Nitrosospira multiformis]PTQ79821.1 integrase [Nitrosospira multiformis]